MTTFRNIRRRLVSWLVLINLVTCGSWTERALAQEPTTIELATPPTEVTWLIVRHADRDGNHDALTEAGHERARHLAALAQVLRVSAIYSTDFQRTRATAQPTADAANLKIQSYEQATAAWFKEVRQANPSGVVLIVAHSNTVGTIVNELTGVEPFEIDHAQYDLLYIVKEVFEDRAADQVTARVKKTSLVQLNYGDSKKAPQSPRPDQMGPTKSTAK